MDGTVLYELHFPFVFVFMQFLILVVFFSAPRGYAFIIAGSSLESDGEIKKTVRVVSYTAMIILTMNFFALDKGLLDCYCKIEEQYKVGQYQVISGEVHDFVPSRLTNKGDESFSVNGIIFEYDMMEYKIGYQRTKPFGGKIRNGQQLQIKYVVWQGENRIVYIKRLQVIFFK